jgi:hypothetical protein
MPSAAGDAITTVYGQYDKRQVVSVMGPSGRVYSGNALCCMSPQNRVRLGFIWLAEQPLLENLTLLVILANSAVLAIQGPPDYPDAPIPPLWADRVELLFTLLFTSEMLIKIFAMGFACHRGAYLSDGWNRLDFLVVMLGWLPYILPDLMNLSAIRSLRALRPLRSISVLPGVKRQAATLLDSMPKVRPTPQHAQRDCAVARMPFSDGGGGPEPRHDARAPIII